MTPMGQQESVIPATAWAVGACLSVVAFLGLSFVMMQADGPPLLRLVPPVLVAGSVGAYALLLGYIYGDARRRSMRYVMWTWLAALIPNAIGIILYFVLREPIPVHCCQCGAVMQAGFAFCPLCGCGTAPACVQCKRITQAGWSHCAYCGAKL
jgi:hypothetical protein